MEAQHSQCELLLYNLNKNTAVLFIFHLGCKYFYKTSTIQLLSMVVGNF